MADRMSQISQFLHQSPAAHFQTLTAISGDASFRRYFRVSNGTQHWVLMDAPAVAADLQRFIATAEAFRAAGLQVPQIVDASTADGLLLLEDFGDNLLQTNLKPSSVVDWYRQAIQLLPAIQQLRTTSDGPLPVFDAAFIDRELQIFTEWCWQSHLQEPLDAATSALLTRTFAVISENVQAQPQAGMHRDFHCRNLMVLADNSLGVIDFQDAVLGPVTYDLVSLLRDCYLRWPDALVEQLALEALAIFRQQPGWPADLSDAEFLRYLDWTGLQRHIKVLGIFCRLYHRDGKAGYLADLPRVSAYVAQISGRYAELAEFHQWFISRVAPAFVE